MGALHVNAELSVVNVELKFGNDGKSWVKLRLVSKERIRDANGSWTDGDPTFIDGYVSGKPAENLVESVQPGDQVIVVGKVLNKPWTTAEGEKRDGWRINITDIGVSTRFTTAPSERSREIGAPKASAPAEDDIFSAPQNTEDPPF